MAKFPTKTTLQSEIAALTPMQFSTLYEQLRGESKSRARLALIDRCRSDVALFARTFFPHYCQSEFNALHCDWFVDWSAEKRGIRRVDAAPRGHAKSTLKTLIKPIHDLCYGLENFVVIISDTASQATGKLFDIRSELLQNALLNEYYGPFFKAKKVAETSYIAESGGHQVLFEAYGAGSEIRGIRFGESRPSKIILDDAENTDEVHNEELRAKRESWHKEVVSKLGDKTTNIEVVGTVLHRDSLLKRLLANPRYQGRLYKAVISWSEREDLWQAWREIFGNLDNPTREADARRYYEEREDEMLRGTEVLWPENFDYYALMVDKFEIGGRSFSKELQNEPLASDQALFSTFHWYTEVPGGLLIERTGTLIPWAHLSPAMASLDPATGQTKPRPGKLGDFSSLLIGYKDPRGRVFVHHDWTKRAPPTAWIKAIFDLHDLFRMDKVAIETNLYRNLLLPNIETAKKEREKERKANKVEGWGINIKFYDVENLDNKIKRIYTLEPKVENGYILFNKALSGEFKNQMESFPLGEHDDGPDALEMLWSLANGRYEFGAVPLNAQRGR